MSAPEHLFVYGTLRPGRAPAALRAVVATLRSLGAARLRGDLYDLGAFPGAVLDAATDHFVFGEVVALSASSPPLSWFDDYEGTAFRRERVRAELDDGRVVSCWVYVLESAAPRAARIASGEWKADGN